MAYAKRIRKHPDERVTVQFNFFQWLNDNGLTHVSHVFAFDTGIAVFSDSYSAGLVSALIGGGETSRAYLLACEMTANDGQVKRIAYQIRVSGRQAYSAEAISGGNTFSSDNPATLGIDGGSALDDTSYVIPIDGGGA